MKASEIIKKLQELIEEHGDQKVFHVDDYDLFRGIKFVIHNDEENCFTLEEI